MAEPDPHTEPHPDVAGYLLGALDAAEAQAFAEHLPRCEPCRSELAELSALPGLLADVPAAEVLPPDLEQRTFAAIDAAAATPPATVVPIQRARTARTMTPRRALIAAAAAVVVVALGVGILASVGKPGGGQAPIATVQLISATGGPARAIAVVTNASGGVSIDMRVDGLAPNPPGTMYTCWLVGPGDSLAHQNRVSVGSFVVRGAGAVHVRWTTAANRDRFPHLGVTLEPANGDPRHQGPKVLAGP